MGEKKINNSAYVFLARELNHHVETGTINREQYQTIMDSYQVKEGWGFIRIILSLGAVLVGLGILTFIASNWAEMSKTMKLMLIIGSYLGVNIASLRLDESYPKLSRSLLYLSALIYGAGIFLIGQMFNFGGHFTGAFLLWGLGLIPIFVIFEDKVLFAFSHVLFIVYLNGYFDLDMFPWLVLPVLPLFYYINYQKFEASSLMAFLSNTLALNTLLFILNDLNVSGTYIALIFFLLGLSVYFVARNRKDVFHYQAGIVMGIAGFFLTFRDVWSGITAYSNEFSIAFAILFLLFLIWQSKDNLLNLFFVCFIILRFYFDTFYNFMPKSLFFISGGLILLGFGFYFEKMRRKGGVAGEK